MTSTRKSRFLTPPTSVHMCPHELDPALEVCGYSIFTTQPVPLAQDRYPYPTRTQNYYPTRPVPAGIPLPVTVKPFMHRLVYVPTMLTCLQLGMSHSLISRLLMIRMTKYFYTNIAKKEETKKGKGGAEEGRGRGRGSLTYEALTTSFS